MSPVTCACVCMYTPVAILGEESENAPAKERGKSHTSKPHTVESLPGITSPGPSTRPGLSHFFTLASLPVNLSPQLGMDILGFKVCQLKI